MSQDLEIYLEMLEEEMPLLVPRHHERIQAWTGVTAITLSTLDSRGLGPGKVVFKGRQVFYPRDVLIKWISERMKKNWDKEKARKE